LLEAKSYVSDLKVSVYLVYFGDYYYYLKRIEFYLFKLLFNINFLFNFSCNSLIFYYIYEIYSSFSYFCYLNSSFFYYYF
jgi:hypothetical protein